VTPDKVSPTKSILKQFSLTQQQQQQQQQQDAALLLDPTD
jgi:hypothetical protein